VHGALDVAGLIPGLGEIADGANALIYLKVQPYRAISVNNLLSNK